MMTGTTTAVDTTVTVTVSDVLTETRMLLVYDSKSNKEREREVFHSS